MFSHVVVGSNDIARSKIFYDALFGAIGGKAGVQDAKGRLLYMCNGGLFMVSKPIDGNTAIARSRGKRCWSALTQAGAKGRIIQERRDFLRQRLGISRRDEKSRDAILDDLGNPAHPRGHDRACHRLGLQQDLRDSLVGEGGKREDIE